MESSTSLAVGGTSQDSCWPDPRQKWFAAAGSGPLMRVCVRLERLRYGTKRTFLGRGSGKQACDIGPAALASRPDIRAGKESSRPPRGSMVGESGQPHAECWDCGISPEPRVCDRPGRLARL